MNIEYEVTIDDDLDAIYTKWVLWLKEGKFVLFPTSYFPLAVCVMSIGLIVWGFFESVREDRYALFFGGGLCLLASIILFFLYKPSNALLRLSRKEIEKEYKNYFPNREQRNIILAAKEFILKTANSETAWSWQALKLFRREEKGFELYFFSGHEIFIPKRAFSSEQQLTDFQCLVEQHQNRVVINER